MRSIKMVDLKRQYKRIKNELDIAMTEVITSTSFIRGSAVECFERELGQFLSVNNVIGCANGTDALQISLMALDIKSTDEVITTPFTFVATAEVIALLGANPVFVDVFEDSFNINTTKLETAITSKTKAILPVHLFGQSAEMDKISSLAKKYNLSIIEDTAQAIGAKYKNECLGTIGDIGTTSFFPSKNLGCYGDGGALFTNDNKLANRIRSIANHGQNKKYLYNEVGVNSRLDSLQASILSVKLKYLDEYTTQRNRIAKLYNETLSNTRGLVAPICIDKSTHVFHQYTIRVRDNKRDGLHKYLLQKKIPNAIYYPLPLHLQKPYKKFGYKEGDFPVAEQLSKEVLSLPMHTELDDDQVDYITKSILEFL